MDALLAPGVPLAGRYVPVRRVGAGGMSEVWEARDSAGHPVALKLLRASLRGEVDLRRRLLREAQALAAVSHPHVVRVLDVAEVELPGAVLDVETVPVLVLEFLEGETLGARLARDGAFAAGAAAALLLPAVGAVRAAHARGIVHRDLKPENLFLVTGQPLGACVRVLDFGVARLLDPGTDHGSSGLTTRPGARLGTPRYMAPEQALGDRTLDHRADVWALGVILYECLSGIRPIDGDSVIEVYRNLARSVITPLEHLGLGIPADLCTLVGAMLRRDVHARLADLVVVERVLGALAVAAD